ncbi:Asp23/Gls24 family envelope stress response protein [Actinomycetaceae bacterium TAE3-ERU4]|nr:Asp23/Gls24 family envelope stress response protein [Actinomycetaceae bacterium TAE3-ERU4]
MAESKNLPQSKTAGDKAKELTTTDRGEITIADQVVAKVAGLAMAEVKGVYAVGGGFSRAIGAAREALGGSKNITQGVSVEVGKKQAAIDLTLIVEYPNPIHEVAEQVRESVLKNVENLVGLEVVEVNIDVTDVHVPGLDKDEEKEENKEESSEEPRVK